MPKLQGPTIYPDFLARTSDLVRFPHLSRHPLAAAAQLNGETQAWGRIQGEAREGFSNPEPYREDLACKLVLFLLNYFIVLVIAVYTCMWIPRWRMNYLILGACPRNAESK